MAQHDLVHNVSFEDVHLHREDAVAETSSFTGMFAVDIL